MAFDRNAEADQAYGHKPVLLDECLEALAIRPDGVYLDGTLGRAGHSLEILRRLTAGGRLIGLDRDGTALEAARVRLAEYADRVTLIHSNFSRLAEVLDDLHIDAVDGMLFDLGVSSPQLDDAERGFSYMHDAPLDMRMDRTAGLTARDVVNGWSYEELRRILFEYGEERYAPAIARHILERREKAPIETTGQLVEVIRSAMPPAALREKQRWIPVTERPPEERTLVNVVWVNRVPEPYYKKIKGVPFSDTACFYRGRWYWDSPAVLDLLAEYGEDASDLVDEAVEITHWMPLPGAPEEGGKHE